VKRVNKFLFCKKSLLRKRCCLLIAHFFLNLQEITVHTIQLVNKSPLATGRLAVIARFTAARTLRFTAIVGGRFGKTVMRGPTAVCGVAFQQKRCGLDSLTHNFHFDIVLFLTHSLLSPSNGQQRGFILGMGWAGKRNILNALVRQPNRLGLGLRKNSKHYLGIEPSPRLELQSVMVTTAPFGLPQLMQWLSSPLNNTNSTTHS
jgi:hypothetical protein